MSNHNVPISLEMELDDQGCQFDLYMTFDVAPENHVIDLEHIDKNISIGAPSSSPTNQELATFNAPTSSRGSGVGDPKLLAIEGASAIEEILKVLQKQVKFWKPWSCNALTWAFFCVNDGKPVDLINAQVMKCIICYNEIVGPTILAQQTRMYERLDYLF
jgi:hypothetical protein